KKIKKKSGHCKAHEKTHEEQPEKPHSCADCGMCFFKASALRRHFLSHTGEKPFKCTLCESCFSRSEGLKRHMRSHTGERPYKCIICGKQFYSRQDLNIHGLTHTGEKPHLCPVCGKGFSQLGNMKEHRRSHAHRQMAGDTSKEILRFEGPSENPDSLTNAVKVQLLCLYLHAGVTVLTLPVSLIITPYWQSLTDAASGRVNNSRHTNIPANLCKSTDIFFVEVNKQHVSFQNQH
uniref:C2H2-type domain-containing protein n=1 Tax=Maylandia zebra TaxID=106582 RepID=A0A3P9DBK6_9CICH